MRRLTLLLLMVGTVAWTSNPGQNTGGRSGSRATASPGPASALLGILRDETNPDQAMRDVVTIWETDRWFTFPKFEETAKNVAAIMRRAGLEDVEIGNPPADGVTQGGFWTLPLAWDVKVGTLEIVEPQVPADSRMLADYQKIPTSIGMWSGPTPIGGVVTDVVLASSDLQNVKGKLVLGQGASKSALAKAGGVGAHEVDRMIRALADDDQLASELIAEQESLRHRVVGEAGRYKTLGREPDRFWSRRR